MNSRMSYEFRPLSTSTLVAALSQKISPFTVLYKIFATAFELSLPTRLRSVEQV